MYRDQEIDTRGQRKEPRSYGLSRRSFLGAGAAALLSPAALAQSVVGPHQSPAKFRRIPTQYIAALADPDATAGSNAHWWGLWRVDPGPRGVRLDDYDRLMAAGGVAPAQWQFDSADWWLEEHGLIMEAPDFPLPGGRYVVTGGRQVTTVLTVDAAAENGSQRWTLDDAATIYDVTHLRCRSARYTPATSGHSCSPAKASSAAFPVAPGGAMPPVEGCNKQDYAVLIVVGMLVA